MKPNYRFVTTAVILLLISLFLLSCKSKPVVVLRVGTNAEYPPFEYKKNNQFVGVDMDLIRLLAERLDMKIVIMDMQFNSLIPALTSNKIDLAISAITISDERQVLVDFSIPYYKANQVLIAPKYSAVSVQKLNDIAKYQIGTQMGTTGQSYLEENLVANQILRSDQLKTYGSNRLAIQDMMDGNVDMVIIDDSAARGYSTLQPIKIIYEMNTQESYGIAMSQKSPHLKRINAELAKIIKSGEMDKIIQANGM